MKNNILPDELPDTIVSLFEDGNVLAPSPVVSLTNGENFYAELKNGSVQIGLCQNVTVQPDLSQTFTIGTNSPISTNDVSSYRVV